MGPGFLHPFPSKLLGGISHSAPPLGQGSFSGAPGAPTLCFPLLSVCGGREGVFLQPIVCPPGSPEGDAGGQGAEGLGCLPICLAFAPTHLLTEQHAGSGSTGRRFLRLSASASGSALLWPRPGRSRAPVEGQEGVLAHSRDSVLRGCLSCAGSRESGKGRSSGGALGCSA